jgi:hypothetical protein
MGFAKARQRLLRIAPVVLAAIAAALIAGPDGTSAGTST